MECCTEHRFLRAKMSLAIKKKMRKSGSKVTKRIDVTNMACEEKLERFQSTVQVIDLAQDWIQILVTIRHPYHHKDRGLSCLCPKGPLI